MGMRMYHVAAGCIALMTGCTQSSTPGPGNGGVPEPGRFSHSAIRTTIAPWDGPATQLFLAEKPLDERNPVGPHVSIRVYKSPGALSNQRLRLEGKESRQGVALWVSEGGSSAPLAWAEIDFQEVREGRGVTGTYDVAFPDGARERGRFQAIWWTAEGKGG